MEYPQFVILKHMRKDRALHWDLMLEADKVLHTWRLDVHPSDIDDERLAITRISDHPLKFLDYEGAVNEGKGTVEIADSGFFRMLGSSATGVQTIEFNGRILKGRFTLEHIARDQWLLTCLPE
ncbi:MAG TPA: DNA polymerase ligase N-terminal domain-containing protein [Sedimentisphaerales bacterium]|nr:DNA polymerase ligase N-terminal domain-containing protein [Sedimentisphaerales bacterium]